MKVCYSDVSASQIPTVFVGNNYNKRVKPQIYLGSIHITTSNIQFFLRKVVRQKPRRSLKTQVNIEVLRIIMQSTVTVTMRWTHVFIYSNNFYVHLWFPGLILSYFPLSYGKQSTLTHSGKLPAVTHVLSFKTACRMTSSRCDFAWLSAKKQ